MLLFGTTVVGIAVKNPSESMVTFYQMHSGYLLECTRLNFICFHYPAGRALSYIPLAGFEGAALW